MDRAIGKAFSELRKKSKKAFIPFIVAGDPDLDVTIRLVPELEQAGSHIVELGIPFSDPIADGPTIQRAAGRALMHRYSMSDYLKAVEAIRRKSGIPILLFSYFNPILQYGIEALARDARAAGVDGMLTTDLIPEEAEEYCACLDHHDLDSVFLAAPTSSAERIAKIAACSRGFIYIVSRTGVTGAQEKLSESVLPTIGRVRQHTEIPVAVGFGISNPGQVQAVWAFADGAVVGSAIVAEMEKLGSSSELPSKIGEFCRWLTGSKKS